MGNRHQHDLFRLETMPQYLSASDGTELERYRSGKAGPDREAKRAWLDRLRSDSDAGRRWRRVRLVEHPVSEYVRYSCEWGYTDNSAAGEEVRILDLADAPAGTEWLRAAGDFYLVDGAAAAMKYDMLGAFEYATPIRGPLLAAFIAISEAAWSLAVPFPRRWADHPELQRPPASS